MVSVEFAVQEQTMRSGKKIPHALFVEEENYNWAPVRRGYGRVALAMMVVAVVAGVLLISLSR
ncbi:MAG: hypothetical protein RLZZ385_373 [Pseudomonadota bacterium]|jgi:hypothetical protein